MILLNIQLFAHKKGVGSTKNGRDSESKRLGVKRADGQIVLAGNILQVLTLEEVQTIVCLLKLVAELSLKDLVVTVNVLAFMLRSSVEI